MPPTDQPAARGAVSTRSIHQVAFLTEIGRTHRVNQDAGGAWTLRRRDGTSATLLIVADGVSAGRRSEEASRLTTELLRERLLPLLSDEGRSIEELLEALADGVREANHAVSSRPHASAGTADATTLAAAISVGEALAGVWVGDSRIYRVTGSQIEQLTRDHSWAEGVVSLGYMTAEEAASDPRAGMITRWLGPPDQADPGIEGFRTALAAGDTVFCCSDGLYRYFSPPISVPDEMAGIVAASGDLAHGTDRLVQTAIERGGHDDITIAAMRVEAVS